MHRWIHTPTVVEVKNWVGLLGYIMYWNSSGGLLSSDRHRISAVVECCTIHSTIAIKMSNTVHLSTNNPTID